MMWSGVFQPQQSTLVGSTVKLMKRRQRYIFSFCLDYASTVEGTGHIVSRFLAWLKTLCSVVVLCYMFSNPLYIPASGFGPKWVLSALGLQQSDCWKTETLFPCVSPQTEVLDTVVAVVNKNGKSKLKQIGRAPVFPRTICEQHFF